MRSVKSECLSHFSLFGEGSLRRALKNFCEHYHGERNHQGKANQLLFPGRLPRSVCRDAFDASSGWAGCSSTTTRRRPEVTKPLEQAGFWLSGLVCGILAVLKLATGAQWSWWRVSLPLCAVLGHNILYIIVGFVWLSCAADGAAEEAITIRPDSVHIPRGFTVFDEFLDRTASWRLERTLATMLIRKQVPSWRF